MSEAPAAKFERVFGLPEQIDLFLDKKPRNAYPQKYKTLNKFMNHIMLVDQKSLWRHCMSEKPDENLYAVLTMTFQEDDFEDLMENINGQNYPLIMREICLINNIPAWEEKDSVDDPNGGRA